MNQIVFSCSPRTAMYHTGSASSLLWPAWVPPSYLRGERGKKKKESWDVEKTNAALFSVSSPWQYCLLPSRKPLFVTHTIPKAGTGAAHCLVCCSQQCHSQQGRQDSLTYFTAQESNCSKWSIKDMPSQLVPRMSQAHFYISFLLMDCYPLT